MKTLKILRNALVAAALFAAVPALAEVVTDIRIPGGFTLTPGVCPALSSTVTGTGVSHLLVRVTIDKNGIYHIGFTNNVDGTATDEDGASYVFAYTQHYTFNGDTSNPDPFLVPEFGIPPFEFNLTDTFVLNGHGTANQLHVGFLVRIKVDANGNVTQAVFQIHSGVIDCDPI